MATVNIPNTPLGPGTALWDNASIVVFNPNENEPRLRRIRDVLDLENAGRFVTVTAEPTLGSGTANPQTAEFCLFGTRLFVKTATGYEEVGDGAAAETFDFGARSYDSDTSPGSGARAVYTMTAGVPLAFGVAVDTDNDGIRIDIPAARDFTALRNGFGYQEYPRQGSPWTEAVSGGIKTLTRTGLIAGAYAYEAEAA